MTIAHTPLSSEVPAQMRRLLALFRAGDEPALGAALAGMAPGRIAEEPMLVGALCMGGAAFAARLAAHAHEGMDEQACREAVVNALLSYLEPGPDAPDDHEALLAQGLIEQFGLEGSDKTLLDIARAELMVEVGPLEGVPQAVECAMRHQQWELALRGLVRCRHTLQTIPRATFGMAAMCLHKLGRYAEADEWVEAGLGERQGLLAIAPVFSEEQLMQRWGDRAAPVVSIICTTYNHERYIDSAIRGFLSQNCAFPFEILIHDDASTDGTQRIVRHWQALYPRIIKPTLQTQNQLSRGIRPFELMLAQARGQFVATCEGDDFWIDPSKLQRQVSVLQAHPEHSCSAHNYYHFHELSLTVKPWFPARRDFTLTRRQLMGVLTLLWFPTLVFRKTFTAMPPERDLSPIGDQFLTSYLGTQGTCIYLANMYGAVRRENEFSMWSPLSGLDKEKLRVKSWASMVRLHERLGNAQAVADLKAKIDASSLDQPSRQAILDATRLAVLPSDRKAA